MEVNSAFKGLTIQQNIQNTCLLNTRCRF